MALGAWFVQKQMLRRMLSPSWSRRQWTMERWILLARQVQKGWWKVGRCGFPIELGTGSEVPQAAVEANGNGESECYSNQNNDFAERQMTDEVIVKVMGKGGMYESLDEER